MCTIISAFNTKKIRKWDSMEERYNLSLTHIFAVSGFKKDAPGQFIFFMEKDYSIHKVIQLRGYPLLQREMLLGRWYRMEVFMFISKLLGFYGSANLVGSTRVVEDGFIKRWQLQASDS